MFAQALLAYLESHMVAVASTILSVNYDFPLATQIMFGVALPAASFAQ